MMSNMDFTVEIFEFIEFLYTYVLLNKIELYHYLIDIIINSLKLDILLYDNFLKSYNGWSLFFGFRSAASIIKIKVFIKIKIKMECKY